MKKSSETESGFKTKVAKKIKPGKETVIRFQLFKGHHPVVYRIFTVSLVSLLVLIISSTSVLGFINYHAFMIDENGDIDVSTIEAQKVLRTIDILENAGLSSFFYTPVSWRLESLNPVGSVEVGDTKAEYNFTQNYNTLKVTFNGYINNNSEGATDMEILQYLVENVTTLDVNITQYGDLYGAIDGETVVTGTVRDCVREDKRFTLNVYFGGLEYGDVEDILVYFEDRNSLDKKRYVLRELTDITNRDLSVRLDTGRLRPYYELKTEERIGRVFEYIDGVLERELVETPCGFDLWLNSSDTRERLDQAEPSEFLEIIEEYSSQQLSAARRAGEVNCMDYTYLFYDAFYKAKLLLKNEKVGNLHVFPVRSSGIIPGYFTDTGHVYIGVMLPGGIDLQISFVDPHWADQDFPSFLHIFMHTDQERFNAFDEYHHIRVPASEFLLEKQRVAKRNTLVTTMVIVGLFALLVFYFVYIFRTISRIEHN